MTTTSSPRSSPWPILALIAMCLAPLCWLGDSMSMNDEPNFLAHGYYWNHHPGNIFGYRTSFSFATAGFMSNRSVPHGPGVIWLAQALLGISHNLWVVLILHALFCSIITGAALYWLARSAGLNPWMPAVILAAPVLWIYGRTFWDICIPFAVLVLAAYAAFIKTQSRFSLIILIVSGFLLFIIHLMTIALLIPIALDLVLFRARFLVEKKWVSLTTFVICLAFTCPYLVQLVYFWHPHRPDSERIWAGLFYPLLGAHHLASNIVKESIPDWPNVTPGLMPYLLAAAYWITALAYPAVWIGTVLAIPCALRVLRRDDRATILDHVAAICLAAFLFQVALDAVERIHFFPQYHNGTWIIYLVFACLTVRACWAFRPARALTIAYCIALITTTASMVFYLHHTGGTRSFQYGTTVGNQLDVINQISRYSPDSEIICDVPQWNEFPVAYDGLKLFAHAAGPTMPPHRLRIQYTNHFPNDAHIELIDLGPLLP